MAGYAFGSNPPYELLRAVTYTSKRSPDERSDIRGLSLCGDPAYRSAHAGYSLQTNFRNVPFPDRPDVPFSPKTREAIKKARRNCFAISSDHMTRGRLRVSSGEFASRMRATPAHPLILRDVRGTCV